MLKVQDCLSGLNGLRRDSRTIVSLNILNVYVKLKCFVYYVIFHIISYCVYVKFLKKKMLL